MKLLIVVDYQNDFVDGSLGFPGAELLDEKIASIIKNYDDVIFTLDTHFDDYLETFEGKMLDKDNLALSRAREGVFKSSKLKFSALIL